MNLAPILPPIEQLYQCGGYDHRFLNYLELRGDPNAALPVTIVAPTGVLENERTEWSSVPQLVPFNWRKTTICQGKVLRPVNEVINNWLDALVPTTTNATLLQACCVWEKRRLVRKWLNDAALRQRVVMNKLTGVGLLPLPLQLASMPKIPELWSGDASQAIGSTERIGSIDMLRSLLDGGAHADVGGIVSPLLLAVIQDHVPMVRVLLDSGALPTDAADLALRLRHLLLAASVSASVGSLALLRRGRESLFDRIMGGPLDLASGRTCLHYAALSCWRETLVYHPDKEVRSLVHEPSTLPHVPQELETDNETSTSLPAAIASFRVASGSRLKSAIEAVVSEHATTEDDVLVDPELHRREYFCCVVVAMGCPVDAMETASGNTALHLAWKTGKGRLSRVLVELLGASPVLRNTVGDVPFESHSLTTTTDMTPEEGGDEEVRYGLSSAAIAICGGACEIQGDRGCMSPSHFLLHYVYPMYPPDVALEVVGRRGARDGKSPLHRWCERHALLNGDCPGRREMIILLEAFLRFAQGALTPQSIFDAWLNAEDGVCAQDGSLGFTPLFYAVAVGRAPVEFIQTLLQFGSNPLAQSGPRFLRWNVLQVVATFGSTRETCVDLGLFPPEVRELLQPVMSAVPIDAGRIAMLLLSTCKKLIEAEAHGSGGRWVDVLHSVPSHPTHSNGTMMDMPMVQRHPHFQIFVEAVQPPLHEKDRRSRAANRFHDYRGGGSTIIVGEFIGNDDEMSYAVSTPLDGCADETQGAYMVNVGRSTPDDATQGAHRIAGDVSISNIASTAVGALKTALGLGFERPSAHTHQEPHDDLNRPVDVLTWCDELPEGSVLQSTLVWTLVVRWMTDLDYHSSAEIAWTQMETLRRNSRLAWRRHVQLREDSAQLRYHNFERVRIKPTEPQGEAPLALCPSA